MSTVFWNSFPPSVYIWSKVNPLNSFFGAVLACLFGIQVSLVAAARQPVVVIVGPTIVAFFPPTKTESRKNSDTGEALADFQFYAKEVRKRLSRAGIEFSEIYSHSFRIRIGQEVTVFRPTDDDAGYYLIIPGKKPRIEYGVMTDSDLLRVAREYFGPFPKRSHEYP